MSDVVVIGGGLAGAAVATLLARAGRSVVLLERAAGPADKVCGEFLSREAALYLSELGLDLALLGAVLVTHVRFASGRRIAVAPLPFSALSLSRRVLDEALLARGAASGATIRRGRKVRGLERNGAAWTATMGSEMITADTVFLATGKHDLRGWKRPAGWQNDLVAFKQHWQLAPGQAAALDRHVEIIGFPGGYAGLQPVEGGRANLCLVIRQHRFAALGGRWDRLLAALRMEPHLALRLDGAAPCWPQPLAIAAIPYGHLRRHTDGPWRLGDQAAVIPSFSGDGMSIALHSASLAAEMYLGGAAADAFQHRLARDVAGQMRLATALSHGLVRGPVRAALGMAAAWMPGLMGIIAGGTRVTDAALARAGLETDSCLRRKR